MTRLLAIIIFIEFGAHARQITGLDALIDLNGTQGSALVTLDYHLSQVDRQISFRAVLLNNVNVNQIVFLAEDDTLTYRLNGNQQILRGTLNHSGRDDSLSIQINYRISNITDRVTVPVIHLELTPPEAEQGVFSATILKPDDYTFSQSFPAVLEEDCEKGQCFSLQVIPAMIEGTLSPPGSHLVSVTGLIDLLVVMLLAGLSYLGWKKLNAQQT